MKIIRVLLWWIFIFSIPLLLASTTVSLELRCLPFYEISYQKYHVNEITGLSESQLDFITRHLIQFFSGKVENAQLSIVKDSKAIYLFHDYEMKHLEDVREIFRFVYKIQVICFLYFITYLLIVAFSRKRQRWNDFWKGLRNGSIVTVSLLISLGVFVYFSFHWLFIKFHYLVFGDPQNSPWILDPRKDYLIMMYPLHFWQDAAIIGILTIFVTALLIIGISWVFLRKYRTKS